MEKNPTKRFLTEQALRHPWSVFSPYLNHKPAQAYTHFFCLSNIIGLIAGLLQTQLEMSIFISQSVNRWRETLPNPNGR